MVEAEIAVASRERWENKDCRLQVKHKTATR